MDGGEEGKNLVGVVLVFTCLVNLLFELFCGGGGGEGEGILFR